MGNSSLISKAMEGDEEQNDADEEGIVIDDYDDFDEEYEDNEKGHNKKKSSIVLSTDIQEKTGARNRISIDFDATETTKEIPSENEFNPPRASTPTRDIEQSEREPGETRMPWSMTR